MAAKKKPRYDVLVIAENNYQRLPEVAVRTWIHRLAFKGTATPVGEALTMRWGEVYMEPGPAAHEIFTRGVFEGPPPVFHEAVFRFGEEPETLRYDGQDMALLFFLEFRGCLFREPRGEFRKMLKNTLHIRARVLHRPHQEIPPRKTVTDEERAELEEYEANRILKSRRNPKGVGTEITEW